LSFLGEFTGFNKVIFIQDSDFSRFCSILQYHSVNNNEVI